MLKHALPNVLMYLKNGLGSLKAAISTRRTVSGSEQKAGEPERAPQIAL